MLVFSPAAAATTVFSLFSLPLFSLTFSLYLLFLGSRKRDETRKKNHAISCDSIFLPRGVSVVVKFLRIAWTAFFLFLSFWGWETEKEKKKKKRKKSLVSPLFFFLPVLLLSTTMLTLVCDVDLAYGASRGKHGDLFSFWFFFFKVSRCSPSTFFFGKINQRKRAEN